MLDNAYHETDKALIAAQAHSFISYMNTRMYSHLHQWTLTTHNSRSLLDVRNRFFKISVQFRLGFLKKNSDLVWNEFGSVWSEKRGSV